MCSFCTIALYICLHWPGMIFNWLLTYLERYIPLWLHKPVFDCLICMPSVWVTILWFAFGNPLSWLLLVQMLVTVGLNFFPALFIGFLKDCYGDTEQM